MQVTIAQLVACRTVTPEVPGSNPGSGCGSSVKNCSISFCNWRQSWTVGVAPHVMQCKWQFQLLQDKSLSCFQKMWSRKFPSLGKEFPNPLCSNRLPASSWKTTVKESKSKQNWKEFPACLRPLKSREKLTCAPKMVIDLCPRCSHKIFSVLHSPNTFF